MDRPVRVVVSCPEAESSNAPRSVHGSLVCDDVSARRCPVDRPLTGLCPAIVSVPDRSGSHREHALTEWELRAAIDTAIDGMIVIDHAGAIVLYSAACERLFGYAAGEVLGRNIRMLMPSPDRENHDAYLQNYLKSGIARIIGIGRDVTGCRKDGSTFPMHLSVGELHHARDGPLFVGTIHDLSERHRARARIDELQTDPAARLACQRARYDGFGAGARAQSATLGHRGVRRGELGVARPGGIAVPDKVREFMDKAVAQSHRAGGVIRRLRELTRRSYAERSIEDINALIEEACELATLGTKTENVDVRLRLSPNLPPVLVDGVQIQQVVLNLVRNSIEALGSCETRRIVIATARLGDSIEITVSDTGPGLPAGVQDRPFEPFVSTKSGGTGIGLSICRTIAQVHGGDISFRTEAGKGTTFHVAIPAFDETDG